MPGLNDLPNDLLATICESLDHPELLRLLPTNRRLSALVRPQIYKSLVILCDGRYWHVPTPLLSLVRKYPEIAAMVKEVEIVRRTRLTSRPRRAQPTASRGSHPQTSARPWKTRIFDRLKILFGTGTLTFLKRLPNLTRLAIDIHFARSKRLRWREYLGSKPKLPSLRHISLRDERQHLIRARELASCCEYGLRCIESWASATPYLESLHISGAFEDTLRPVKFHCGRLLPVEALRLESGQLSFESLQNMLFHFDDLRRYNYTYVGREVGIPAPKHAFCLQPHRDTLQQLELDMPCVEDFEVYGRFRGSLRSFPSLKVLKTSWSTLRPTELHSAATSTDNVDAWVVYQLPPSLEQLKLTCCHGVIDKHLDHLLMVRNRVMPTLRDLQLAHHRPSEIRSGQPGDTIWNDLKSRLDKAGITFQVLPCSPQTQTEEVFSWAQLQENERWPQRNKRTSSMHARDSDSIATNTRSLDYSSRPQLNRQQRAMRASDASSFVRPPKRNAAAPAQQPRRRRTSEASSYLKPPSHDTTRRGRGWGTRSSSAHQSETSSAAGERRHIAWPPLSERREMSASEAAVVAGSRRRQHLRGSSAYGPYIETSATVL